MGQYSEWAEQYIAGQQPQAAPATQQGPAQGTLPPEVMRIMQAIPQSQPQVSYGPSGPSIKPGASPEQRYGDLLMKQAEMQLGSEMKRGQAAEDKRSTLLSERQLDAEQNFNKVVGQYSQLVAQYKAKLNQQGGEGGLIPGNIGKVRTLLKDPTASAIAAFPGQRVETVMAMNPVLTGQQRVIQGVVEQIKTTLPEETDPATYAAQKVAQSVSNSYRITKAIQDLGITREDLEALEDSEKEAIGKKIGMQAKRAILSSEEQEYIDTVIGEVLSTPPAKVWQLPGFEEEGMESGEALTPEVQKIMESLPEGSTFLGFE